MDWMKLVLKAFGTGVLCSLVYHGTLLIIGQRVTLKNAVAFTVAFSLMYFIWLWMSNIGRKS